MMKLQTCLNVFVKLNKVNRFDFIRTLTRADHLSDVRLDIFQRVEVRCFVILLLITGNLQQFFFKNIVPDADSDNTNAFRLGNPSLVDRLGGIFRRPVRNDNHDLRCVRSLPRLRSEGLANLRYTSGRIRCNASGTLYTFRHGF